MLGEVAAVLYAGAKYFGEVGPVAQRALLNVAEHAMKVWQQPDKGIWEMRGPNRHFTASKVAAWAALDRAIKASDETKMSAPMERLLASTGWAGPPSCAATARTSWWRTPPSSSGRTKPPEGAPRSGAGRGSVAYRSPYASPCSLEVPVTPR